MNYVAVGFDPQLDGSQVFARGHYGLLFNVLERFDPDKATWLHEHKPPKPFSTKVYYTNDGFLAGIHYALFTAEVTKFFYDAWEEAKELSQDEKKDDSEEDGLYLGHQEVKIAHVDLISGPSFQEISTSKPIDAIHLQFVSPTAFKQGKSHLILPLPRNVFYRPLNIWQHYAPMPMRLKMTDAWLDWCAQNVYVSAHQIETVTIAINYHESFTGFVGSASFSVKYEDEEQRRILQTLAHVANFSGVGHKTTMGMGGVHFQADSR